MNPDNFDQQVKSLLNAAEHGDGTALSNQLLSLNLASDNEIVNRLRSAEVQVRFGHFFVNKRTALDAAYVTKPSSFDTHATNMYAETITKYLTDFDDDLDTLEESLEGISTAEVLASNATNKGIQQLLIQALTQEGHHDQAWFLSRAHMTRDGVNESLWSIVTASEGDVERFLSVVENAFRLANEELAMAIKALVPRDAAKEAQS